MRYLPPAGPLSTSKTRTTPTKLGRREFLGTAGVAGAALGFAPHVFAAELYPHASLEQALSKAGFDPSSPGNFLAVFTADTHYGHGTPENILPPIIREVNLIRPRPAFFCVGGDLICSASLSFGQVPGAKQKEKAIEEFRIFHRHLQQLAPEIPARLLLGNHDTHPEETDEHPELFRAVFPERSPYYSFDVGGVHFVCLNGASSGRIAKKQRQWFCEDVRERTGPGKTIVVLCHQPSLGSVTAERGITRAVRAALGDARGEFWFVGGHVHANNIKVFQLPGGNTIAQLSITTGNPEVWGDRNHPGYWVFGFSGGRLAVRVFRKLGKDTGYAVDPNPSRANPRSLPLPFEGRNDLLWKVMIGEGDGEFRVDAKAAWCQNYWHYNRHLVYRFPIALAGDEARRIAVLQTRCYRDAPRFFLSPDGNTWKEAEGVRREPNAFTSFLIPETCRRTKVVYFKLERCTVSGFALLR